MAKETIINQVVNKAYNNLTEFVDLKISAIIGGYFEMIIPSSKLEELIPFVDEIINNLYDKFCFNLSKSITDDDIEFVIYKSFCCNEPNKDLIDDCFKIVNNDIKNKQSSKESTTLFNSLSSLQTKYSEEDMEKSLNTIFDILLDYYSIVKITK